MTIAQALAQDIGINAAVSACQAFGVSTRWIRRAAAYELFEAGRTVQQVTERLGIPRRSAYRYFEQWREIKRRVK